MVLYPRTGCRCWLIIRILAVSLILLSRAGALRAQRQLLPSQQRLFDPGVLVFSGNILAVRNPGVWLMPVDIQRNGHFRIELLFSRNSGRSWYSQVTVPSPGGDWYDPVIVAVGRQLLLASHSDGRLRFQMSTDGGWTWKPRSEVTPKSGDMYSEAFLTSLGGGARVILLYARFSRPNAFVEVRESKDTARSWSDPIVIGNVGNIADGLRASMSLSDDRVSALVAFPRRGNNGSVEVLIQPIGLHDLRPQGGPIRVALAGEVSKATGSFPIVLRCSHENAVVFSEHRPTAESRVMLVRFRVRPNLTAEMLHDPEVLVRSKGALNGFGRVWIDSLVKGMVGMTWVESRTRTKSTIYRRATPELTGCHI